MSSCRTKLTLLNTQLYEIDLEIALLDDKIEDIGASGYHRYMKDKSSSTYALEYLIDKKVALQQKRNNVIYKMKELNKKFEGHL